VVKRETVMRGASETREFWMKTDTVHWDTLRSDEARIKEELD